MTMLDHMLEVMYKQAQQTSIRNQMADGLKHLPVSELKKLASGEMKLAFHDDDDWLCKFKGTPMYDDALQLETQCLELDAQQQQMSLAENEERRARSNERDAIWDQKDAIRLKKRLLELDLRKAELAAAGGGEEFEEPEEELEEAEEEGEEEGEEDEKEAVASYFVRKQLDTVMGKFAAALPQSTPNPLEVLSQRFEQAIQKTAAVEPTDAMQVADLWGRQMAHMDKQAGIGGAMLQGLQGAGKFLGAAGKGVYQAGKAGGVEGAKGALGQVAGLGGQMAGNFVKQNPVAAAALGGGALGTAALGGAAAGRASA